MPRKIALVDGKVVITGTEDQVESTWEDRFKAALRDTRRDGVKVRQNVRKCCNGCIEAKDLGITDFDIEPYVYTYGGQGSAYRWVNGVPEYYPTNSWGRGTKLVKSIYFKHGDGNRGGGFAAATLAFHMRAHGIQVEWDRSVYKCPEIITPYGLEQAAAEAAESVASA